MRAFDILLSGLTLFLSGGLFEKPQGALLGLTFALQATIFARDFGLTLKFFELRTQFTQNVFDSD